MNGLACGKDSIQLGTIASWENVISCQLLTMIGELLHKWATVGQYKRLQKAPPMCLLQSKLKPFVNVPPQHPV